jgi:hypothetical protein
VNVDLVVVVAVVVVGRMVVEFDYIDLGVGIVLHGLMYLVRIIVGVLVLDLGLETRRLLIISVFPYTRAREWAYLNQHRTPPFAYYPYSTHSSFHQS